MSSIGRIQPILDSVERYRAKLTRLINLLEEREARTWRALQHDEVWSFLTERDVKVDPVCRGLKPAPSGIMLGEGTLHRGDYIWRRFPNYRFESPTVIAANVHPNCRCKLVWEDSAEVIEKRLRLEVLLFT